MGKNIESADDWFREFDEIREGLAKARSVVEGLAKQMPLEVSEVLATLDQELRSIERVTDSLSWYFCRNPLRKFLTGQRLSREEFYLLAARGIIVIPSENASEEAYEAFAQYLYEDNEQMGYINPSERPDPPPVPTGNGGWTQEVNGMKIGIVPENVRISFLRPDQLNFFRDFRPELFSRFRKD